MARPKQKTLQVVCKGCHKEFTVKAKDLHRLYCSRECFRKQFKQSPLKYGTNEWKHHNPVVPSE